MQSSLHLYHLRSLRSLVRLVQLQSLSVEDGEPVRAKGEVVPYLLNRLRKHLLHC